MDLNQTINFINNLKTKQIMKKSLLFVAAMFMAVCANAQGQWNAVGADDVAQVKEDKTVISHGTVKSKAGEMTQVAQNEIQNATVFITDGGADWEVMSKDDNTFESQGKTWSTNYIQGGTNGVDASLDKAGTTSAHVEFTPAVAGKVYVAAKYGCKKKIWTAKVPNSVIEAEELDFAAMGNYATDVWGQYITADGGLAAEQATDADVYAALAYDVEPGYTYFFWVSGSKIMLCGLAFDTNGDVNGISNVVAPEADANAPIYNLAGQRVSSNFKGIAIQNGKKFVK